MKPQDFFIGVIDFFSVLLPGTLITYFLMGVFYDNHDVFGPGKIFPSPENEVIKWVFFLIVAYLIGSIVFMIGSFLDRIYDKFLRRTLFQKNYDLTYLAARDVHLKHIDTDEKLGTLLRRGSISNEEYQEITQDPKREIFNTYKWSQHFLLFKSPEAIEDIRRTEADQKFFRSLVVTFFITAVVLLIQRKIPPAIISIVLVVLSFYRYGDLRYKATQKAYEMIVTYFHLEPAATTRPPALPVPEKPVEQHEREDYSTLKRSLTDDFRRLHREQIVALTAGFSKNMKQVSFGKGETPELSADRNESWFCLRGSGVLNIEDAGETVQSILLPNAIIPLPKGSKFSVRNGSNEAIEILVFENS